MSGMTEAACKDTDTRVFFDDIWRDVGNKERMQDRPLRKARAICKRCPAHVRQACFADEMAAEKGLPAKSRHGLFAGLGPLQRVAIEKRLEDHDPEAAPCCPRRNWDPIDWLTGQMVCTNCGAHTVVPPVKDIGDEWTDRHTSLALEVVRYIVEHIEVGQHMPAPATLAREQGWRKADVRRVYDALVLDGTIERNPAAKMLHMRYTLKGHLAASKRWYAPHLAV